MHIFLRGTPSDLMLCGVGLVQQCQVPELTKSAAAIGPHQSLVICVGQSMRRHPSKVLGDGAIDEGYSRLLVLSLEGSYEHVREEGACLSCERAGVSG